METYLRLIFTLCLVMVYIAWLLTGFDRLEPLAELILITSTAYLMWKERHKET